MRKKILCRKPHINTCSDDISQKWFIDYACPDPNPPHNGKLRRKKDYKGLHKFKTFEARMKAAEKKCAELEEKLKQGWNPWIDGDVDKYIYTDQLQMHEDKKYGIKYLSEKTFNFYASRHIEKNCAHLSAATLTTYKSKLRIFSKYLTSKNFHRYDICEITHSAIEDFFTWLINEQKSSQTTVRKYYMLLQKVFAIVEQDVPGYSNPLHNKECPHSPHVKDCAPAAIAPCDLDILIERIKDHTQLYLFVRFMHNCFLRPGMEIRLMKIGWIDFARGTVTVPDAFCKTRKKSVTIPDKFMEVLFELKLHHAPKDFYVFGNNGEPGPKAWGKNYFRNQFVKIRKELDLPNFYKLYSFKHTGNVAAYDAGLNLSSIQHQNGHTSINTTNTYMRRRGIRVDPDIKESFPVL